MTATPKRWEPQEILDLAAHLRGMLSYLSVHGLNPEREAQAADALDAFAALTQEHEKLKLDAAERISHWKEQINLLIESLHDTGAQLELARAELAALKGQTCLTCRFAKLLDLDPHIGSRHLCSHPEVAAASKAGGSMLPTLINGQPFGCPGWTAKGSAT